jgi:hypothetical protein
MDVALASVPGRSATMSIAAPRPLPENDGLALLGERVALNASIPPRLAERMLGTRNPHGKPNSDVVRQLATAADPRRPAIHWLVDFPAEITEREASLYEHPFHHLYRAVRPARGRWWINPHANESLRASLARHERYLATPVGAEPPAWQWFDSAVLPDDTLLAVARDDDFTHGVLTARPFRVWWRKFHSRRSPVLAVNSYPFPWPPRTGLSALSAAQEEHRHAIARAARGDDTEALDAAVIAAYGWPVDLDDVAVVTKLAELNRTRVG